MVSSRSDGKNKTVCIARKSGKVSGEGSIERNDALSKSACAPENEPKKARYFCPCFCVRGNGVNEQRGITPCVNFVVGSGYPPKIEQARVRESGTGVRHGNDSAGFVFWLRVAAIFLSVRGKKWGQASASVGRSCERRV